MNRSILILTVLCALSLPLHAAPVPSVQTDEKKTVSTLTDSLPLSGACEDIYVQYLEIIGLYVEDITTDFTLEHGNTLVFTNVSGTLYGGTVTGEVRVTVEEKVSYRIDISINNAAVKRCAQDLFDPGADFTGHINGSLNISGNDDGDVHGTLSLKLRDTRFASLPRWFTLFSLIDVGAGRTDHISEGTIDISIEKDTFVIQHLMLKANEINVYGAGTVTFDGEADIELYPVGTYKLLKVLPPFAVFQWLQKQGLWWKIHIKGPLLRLKYRISLW